MLCPNTMADILRQKLLQTFSNRNKYIQSHHWHLLHVVHNLELPGVGHTLWSHGAEVQDFKYHPDFQKRSFSLLTFS